MKKVIIILCFIITIIAYNVFGIFVIEPIGAVPEGKTIVYIRYGYNMSFIDSVEGMINRIDLEHTTINRVAAFIAFGKIVEGQSVIRLPYSETLYQLSK